MKTAKEWTNELRQALGSGLRYDPMLTSGKSLIEEFVEAIQHDAHYEETTKETNPADKGRSGS